MPDGPQIGKKIQFGEYYLTRKIASGGMAELYRARKVGAAGFQKVVAIKTLYPHLASNQDFLKMFMDEAKLACQLTHQNIVNIYDLGTIHRNDRQIYFIAMEYVLGKNFAEVIKRGRGQKISLPPKIVAKIILDAAEALEGSHTTQGEDGTALHLVHRDVSPHNILISYEGEVKLVDFGIAKALNQSTVTQPGVLKGKFSYMSPEQAKGEVLDPRSDIYSLGIVMWEALTSTRLFDGDSEAAILAKVLKPEVSEPSSVAEDVPVELGQIAMKCLSPDPKDRYQSARELSKDIGVYLHELGTYPGTYSIRSFMAELFSQEIKSEKDMIRQEGEELRQQLSQPSDGDLTVVAGDGNTVVAPAKKDGAAKSSKGKFITLGGLALAVLLGLLVWHWMPRTATYQQGATAQNTLQRPAVEVPAPRGVTSSVKMAEPNPVKHNLPSPGAVQAKAQENDLKQIRAKLQEGRYLEALDLITQAEIANPSARAELTGDKVKALYSLGVAEIDQHPAEALQRLIEAKELSPTNADIYYQIGRAQTKLKNFQPAVAAYRKAITIDPKLSGANFNLGYILLQEHDFINAKEAFERVVELKPTYIGDAYVNLAVCFDGMNDRKQAIAMLREALKVDPNNQLAQKHLAKLTKNSGTE